MMKNKIVPKIRFKGFSEEWEETPLEDLVDVRSGRDYKHLSDGNIPVYGTGGYMLSVNDALSYNEDAIGIGRKGTIDKPYLLYAPFWTVDTLFYAVPYKNNNLNFIYDIFQQIDWRKKDESTGVPSLSKTAINAIEVYTTSNPEQTHIGNFFQNIDNLIHLNLKNLEKLKNFKKASLEKMFPKKGATTPEIRFKGFSDEWEEKKFGEIATIRRGLTYNPSNIVKEGIRVLRSSNIDEDTFILSKDDVFVSKDAINIDFVDENDILITSANGSPRLVGKHAIIKGIDTHTTVHGGFMLLATTTQPYFVNAFMSSDWYTKFLNLHVAGGNGSIGNLNKNDLEIELVRIPKNINEQIEIGSYFYKLDHLITKQKTQLTKLQNIKKACLDKMFVTKE